MIETVHSFRINSFIETREKSFSSSSLLLKQVRKRRFASATLILSYNFTSNKSIGKYIITRRRKITRGEKNFCYSCKLYTIRFVFLSFKKKKNSFFANEENHNDLVNEATDNPPFNRSTTVGDRPQIFLRSRNNSKTTHVKIRGCCCCTHRESNDLHGSFPVRGRRRRRRGRRGYRSAASFIWQVGGYVE